MTIFLLILGIVSIIVGIILACIDDYDTEDLLNPLGCVLAFIGFIMMFWNLFVLFGGDDKPKNEIAEVVVTDSTQVQVKPDSIYAIQYIITWKTDEEIKCGDVIMKGTTEKEVGDTITINLQ